MKFKGPMVTATEGALRSRRRTMLDRRRAAYGSELERWDYEDWLQATRFIDGLPPALDLAS